MFNLNLHKMNTFNKKEEQTANKILIVFTIVLAVLTSVFTACGVAN